MKIDIHAHTKKTKQGDAITRNINSEEFCDIISRTDVEIIAITNHNDFDKNQYEEFVEKANNTFQIWPGIELDIIESGKRGHLLVIVNPKNVNIFSRKVQEMRGSISPDDFNISIGDTIEYFDNLDVIYVAHYYKKKPCLSDVEINSLIDGVKNKNRVIKEATNSISAGIYISHGHKSIYGSDIQNWNDYISEAQKLPDLRLKVESFEKFCLLLDKDESTIDTVLESKKKDVISINPFNDSEPVELAIYNDINVFFGSKGTGKTEILKAISKCYNEAGMDTHVYESNSDNLNNIYDIKGNNLDISLEEMELKSCSKEINYIKTVTDSQITLISKYMLHYSTKITNRRANDIKIKDLRIEDTNEKNNSLKMLRELKNKISDFRSYISESEIMNSISTKEDLDELIGVLDNIYKKIIEKELTDFIDINSIHLLNELIEVFNKEISKKTGNPQKPLKTGFLEYARTRIEIEQSIYKIKREISKTIPNKLEKIGILEEKGDLEFITNLVVQDGSFNNGEYLTLRNIKKTPQKNFSKMINEIEKSIYKDDLFEKISEFKEMEDIVDIKDIVDLVLFKRYFAINGIAYKPSNGESSMLLLQKELIEDKNIYLLDEPEKSLGNDYISDVIVPILKDKAKMGKTVIIATHDANIAVRTLPYNSIYRKHNNNTYSTYVGNPFSNNLTDILDTDKKLDWKEISMKTLEGGESAFGERGKIYGK